MRCPTCDRDLVREGAIMFCDCGLTLMDADMAIHAMRNDLELDLMENNLYPLIDRPNSLEMRYDRVLEDIVRSKK